MDKKKNTRKPPITGNRPRSHENAQRPPPKARQQEDTKQPSPITRSRPANAIRPRLSEAESKTVASLSTTIKNRHPKHAVAVGAFPTQPKLRTGARAARQETRFACLRSLSARPFGARSHRCPHRKRSSQRCLPPTRRNGPQPMMSSTAITGKKLIMWDNEDPSQATSPSHTSWHIEPKQTSLAGWSTIRHDVPLEAIVWDHQLILMRRAPPRVCHHRQGAGFS